MKARWARSVVMLGTVWSMLIVVTTLAAAAGNAGVTAPGPGAAVVGRSGSTEPARDPIGAGGVVTGARRELTGPAGELTGPAGGLTGAGGGSPARNGDGAVPPLHAADDPGRTPARIGGALDPSVSAAVESGSGRVSVLVHLRGEGPRVADSGDPALGPTRNETRRQAHAAAAEALLDQLEREHEQGRVGRIASLWVAGVVAVEADPDVVKAIAARPDVRLVTLDRAVESEPWAPVGEASSPHGVGADGEPTWNIDMIDAPEAWRSLGIDGTGSVVAVVDTGVDYHHPALISRYRGYVGTSIPSNGGNWWCRKSDPLCGFNALYPADGQGHGTHVAGIAVAPDGIGVAPGARWIAARVCQDLDTCHVSWVMEALQWLLESGPDRLPDVVNLSLSLEDTLGLLQLTNALHDSDVVVVAAAGNQPEMVRAPAMYPNVVAVGAVTDEGVVWPRSGRGFSLTDEYKPDVVAPGTAITSTIPGGGWARATGTSMAAPHVAGTVALLRQASPDLSAAAIVEVLERTATPLARLVPDPASGWGLVNSYQAVRSVMDVGTLHGAVADAGDGEPIAWARVRIASEVGDPVAQADVADDGSYSFDLAPGEYLVVAEAFTYATATQRQVTVVHDGTTQVDFELVPDEPVGYLAGTLSDAETGARLDGEIRLEDVPSRFYIPVDKHTGFSQRLPADTYRLQVARFGYRVLTDTVKVSAGVTVERDYTLTPAPRVLLVDGDAWAYGAAVGYFETSLDRLGYVYHLWRVTDETAGPGAPGGPPGADELGEYDLVVWTSSITGPTYVMGARPISAYLEAGGSLILSGQDALCTDARTDNATDPCNEKSRPDPYVRDQLGLRVIRDSSESLSVIGSDGGPLQGMTIPLNGGDSMDNQAMPDVLAVVDDLTTDLIAEYPGVGGAAAFSGTCAPHRAVALGFGFEGISSAAQRDEVMARLIAAVTDPLPEVGAHAGTDTASQLESPGATALYTVTLHSTGSAPASYEVAVEGADWPTELWQAGFTGPLQQPIELGHCEAMPVGVRVVVPEDAGRGDKDIATVTVRGDTGADASVDLTTKTPAPVLVVDGDFARNTEERYLSALDGAGVAYDLWELGLYESRPEPPPPETVADYPITVWFTGDDWRQDGSLDVSSQRTLADYLDSGGRLYFSSQDYLSIRGEGPFEDDRLFHEEYLGVRRFDADAGRAHEAPVSGAPGSVLGGIDDCRLSRKLPGEDYSDALEPVESYAQPALLSAFGRPVGTQAAAKGFKSLFLALDAGQLDETCADEVMVRALDWFSPMHGSRLVVSPDSRLSFASGDEVRLRLQLLNDGPRAVDRVHVRWVFPEGGSLDDRWTPPAWSWDESTRSLTWTGDIASNQRLVPEPEVVLQLDEGLGDRLTMESYADIAADGITITRRAAWRVNAPDLSESYKSVPDPDRNLTRGDTAHFVVNVRNTGTRDLGAFVVTDTLPAGLTLVPESVFVDSGSTPDLDTVPGGIVWRGAVDMGRATSMSYSAVVSTYRGGWLRNRAILTDAEGESMTLSAAVFARPTMMFPWAGAEVDNDP
ncbi:MAG: S8 family serine peptidase [Anaerolineae bacterium]